MNTEMESALQAIASMLERSERAQVKFAQGTSQHTLQKNRINALRIASALIKKEYVGGVADEFTEEELKAALAPLTSLISKSEKARTKLAEGSWQHTMLGHNLRALHTALPLLRRELDSL